MDLPLVLLEDFKKLFKLFVFFVFSLWSLKRDNATWASWKNHICKCAVILTELLHC